MKSLETGPFSFKIVNLGRRFSPLTKLVFLSDEQFDGIMSYELTITNCQQHYSPVSHLPVKLHRARTARDKESPSH